MTDSVPDIPTADFLLKMWQTDWFWGCLTEGPAGHIRSCWFIAETNVSVGVLRARFAHRLGLAFLWDVLVTTTYDDILQRHMYRLSTKGPLHFTHPDIQKDPL